tara:strand:+ start:182 stop:520 length:339 start_codon:yes stop_codon:yes gene_type:complete
MANLKEIVCTPENPFGVEREMSDADQKLYDDLQKQFDDNKSERQLAKIRRLRNQKLIETDYLATSDNVMSDEMKAFRKSMRDLPQDYSADKYDELLATDEQDKLTHSVWSKP